MRRSVNAPTLQDVATAAGVSPMTVSRVVNGDAKVRAETRARVKSVIARLDYAPNPAARVLAGAARVRLRLLFGNPSRAFLSEVLVGCLTQASRQDVQLTLQECADEDEALRWVRGLAPQELDGAILPPPFCDMPALLAALADANVRTGVLATAEAPQATCSVSIDDRCAAFDMTAHLIAQGHRRIGFITGDPNLNATGLRLAGYHDALVAAGLCPEPDLIVAGDFSYRSGLSAARSLLHLPVAPTAIFASNDDMAAAAVAAAHIDRLDVPRDISICGFDDTALATAIAPELTTVRQPIAAMAQALTELLVAATQQPQGGRSETPQRRIIAHEVVTRGSTTSISPNA